MSSAYSPMETRILSVLRGLPKGIKINTPTLILKVYGDASPLNPGQSMISAIKTLTKKVERNSEVFTIGQSDRKPPMPLEFWLEKKAKS